MLFFIIYTLLIVVFILFFMYAYNYKKEFIHKLEKKDNPLRFMYGLSAFILDKTDYLCNRKSDYNLLGKLEKLNVGKEVKHKAYCFRLYRISFSLVIFIVFMLIGYAKYTEVLFFDNGKITKITRAGHGEGSTKYSFTAEFENGESEKIEISLDEERYTEEEIYKIFDEAYPLVIEKVLGENKTLNYGTKDLILINDFNGIIDIAWNMEDEEYIDFSGKIQWNNIKENMHITLDAIFSMENVSKTYSIEVMLDKDKRNQKDGITDEIINYILNYSPYEKNVELPEYIDEKKVNYKKNKADDFIVYPIIAILLGLAFYIVKNKDLDEKIKQRQEQLEIDYISLVNKISILHSSGMTIMAAWDKIIFDYDKHKIEKRYVYEEMKVAKKKMLNGYSETDVILEFGKKCGLQQYIKFSNLLEQNIKKGTKGLKDVLKQEVNEANEIRRALALKKGDAAGTKMLLPMGIMLVISIVMIIIPAFMSMNL